MRRIAIVMATLLAFVIVQGCGTSGRDKKVVQKPAPAPVAPKPVEVKKEAPAPKPAPAVKTAAEKEAVMVSPYSSKGGTAARPGTVKVDLKRASPASSPKPAPAAPPAKPAPPKKEVVKAEPKPVVAPAPKPTPPPKAAPAPKPAPTPKAAAAPKPQPQPKQPTPKKEVAPSKPVPAPKPVKPATATVPAAKAATEPAVAKPGTTLGVVRQVNTDYKFLVIEFEGDKPLAVGTPFQIWRKGKLVAKARLDEPLEHWPLGVATLLEGDPQPEDTVTP